MASLHIHVGHDISSRYEAHQFVHECSSAEYHHPTVKMIRVITAQLDVRFPSNHHGIAAYAW